ncbi:hypothetical protein L596_026067 [Steinernema carpocapsae]|uniref:Cadherin domain-containing protein n=1 Tax=Steinernema carpocapsae TaxID=34508 RepID=A0A4U5M095_STECR|nr:hypothetical protein L596_026067 [Steinernema carpocapsae]
MIHFQHRIPNDAPPGWLVVDLANDHEICSPNSRSSIEHSKYSRYFHLSSLCRLTTNRDLSHLAGLNIPVTLISTSYDADTPISTFVYILVEVLDVDALRFESTVYATEINSDANAEDLLEFIRPVQLNDPQKEVTFEIKKPLTEETPLVAVLTRVDDFGKRFAEIAISRNVTYKDTTLLHRAYIIALDNDGPQVACARIEIVVRASSETEGSVTKVSQISAKLKPSKPIRHRRDHHRRDLGNDIIIELPEAHPRGILDQKIRLFGDERVILAPVVKDQISVGSDGSIELIGELDFEKSSEIMLSVQIEDGYGNGKSFAPGFRG